MAWLERDVLNPKRLTSFSQNFVRNVQVEFVLPCPFHGKLEVVFMCPSVIDDTVNCVRRSFQNFWSEVCRRGLWNFAHYGTRP